MKSISEGNGRQIWNQGKVPRVLGFAVIQSQIHCIVRVPGSHNLERKIVARAVR